MAPEDFTFAFLTFSVTNILWGGNFIQHFCVWIGKESFLLLIPSDRSEMLQIKNQSKFSLSHPYSLVPNRLNKILDKSFPSKLSLKTTQISLRMQYSLLSESENVSHSVMSNSLQPHARPSLTVEFSRPEYWSGYSSGDLPDLGIKPRSPAWQADSLPSEPPGKPYVTVWTHVEFQ